jgi:hypothetical protein
MAPESSYKGVVGFHRGNEGYSSRLGRQSNIKDHHSGFFLARLMSVFVLPNCVVEMGREVNKTVVVSH